MDKEDEETIKQMSSRILKLERQMKIITKMLKCTSVGRSKWAELLEGEITWEDQRNTNLLSR